MGVIGYLGLVDPSGDQEWNEGLSRQALGRWEKFWGRGISVASVMARGRKRVGWLKRGCFFGWAMRVGNWPRREATGERAGVAKSDGQWPPLVRVEVGPVSLEMAIGCLTPVGTSDDSETH